MSTLKTSNITDGTNTASTEQLCRGTAKAWVVFNGVGTVAVLNSYNISSITDDGVGRYTLNFTKPMKNFNYAYSGAGRWNYGSSSAVHVGQNTSQAKLLTALPIQVSNSSTGAAVDLADVTVIVHGD